MKRASYKDAIDYVAHNDSPGDDDQDVESITGLVSVQLIHWIFDVPAEKVAKDVLKIMKEYLEA